MDYSSFVSYRSLWLLTLALIFTGCSKPVEKPKPEPHSYDPATLVEHTAPAPVPTPPMFVPPRVEIPKPAWDLICDAEVGTTSEAYYMSHKIRFPEWSGGYSGITWGIGYDGSTEKYDTILRDWKKLEGVERLAATYKYHGHAAKEVLTTVNDILVPWSLAVEVFDKTTIPRFYQLTMRTFPGAGELDINAQGALVSMVYNRGGSLVGDSRVDMRDIANCVPKKDYRGIARALRHMNVTMSDTWRRQGVYAGLSKRREAEAEMVESCIK